MTSNHSSDAEILVQRAAAMLALMERFFTQDAWPYRVSEDTIRTSYQGKTGQWMCFARARAATLQYSFYSICPIRVPEDRLARMAEFLSRANYGLVLANFELDFRDGELRCKTSLDVEGLPLDYPPTEPWALNLFQQIVYANVVTMDRYLPGILRVIASEAVPAELIDEIEGNPRSA